MLLSARKVIVVGWRYVNDQCAVAIAAFRGGLIFAIFNDSFQDLSSVFKQTSLVVDHLFSVVTEIGNDHEMRIVLQEK